jgi:hypothetical protein
MIIRFEPFIRKGNLVYELPFESWVLLVEIKEYIERRLSDLKEEIDREEANGPEENPCGIIVHFPKGIEFRGYQKQLSERMKKCFEKAERDIQFFWFRFDDRVRTLLEESDH